MNSNKDDILCFLFVILYFDHYLAFRKCNNCQQLFATKRGLQIHCSRNEQNECGRSAKKVKKAKIIKEWQLRKDQIHSAKMKRIGPHLKNLSRPHKRGAALTKGEKEMVCYTYDRLLGMYYRVANYDHSFVNLERD